MIRLAERGTDGIEVSCTLYGVVTEERVAQARQNLKHRVDQLSGRTRAMQPAREFVPRYLEE